MPESSLTADLLSGECFCQGQAFLDVLVVGVEGMCGETDAKI